MINGTKDGIICDYCGNEHAEDFTYFSVDIDRIIVEKWIRSPKTRMYSLDFCPECMQSWKDRLNKTYQPPKNNVFVCDISGSVETKGDFTLYYCNVSEVTVNNSSQPYMCSKCRKPRNISDGPCPCSKTNRLVREGKVFVDQSHLEFNINTYVFDLLLQHLKDQKHIEKYQNQ
jgi:hypothetical protein